MGARTDQRFEFAKGPERKDSATGDRNRITGGMAQDHSLMHTPASLEYGHHRIERPVRLQSEEGSSLASLSIISSSEPLIAPVPDLLHSTSAPHFSHSQ